MKLFIGVVSLLLVGLVASAEYECHSAVENGCRVNGDSQMIGKKCTAAYGGVIRLQPNLQAYTREQFDHSFNHLLLSTFYNSYQRDRPGFSKLFRKLSDDAFENSIKLIKHISKRGGIPDLFYLGQSASATTEKPSADFTELKALARALDIEKSLTDSAMALAHTAHGHDAEVLQFVQEEFLEKQTGVVRKLAGYVTDLSQIMHDKDANNPLGIYLFDQYLEKQ